MAGLYVHVPFCAAICHYCNFTRGLLDEARPLSDVLWLMATEGRRLDTPERQAGLIATLDEQVRMIADEAVRKAYRETIKDRKSVV